MLPYIIIALFLLILAIRFDVNGIKKSKGKWITIATLVLILFSGFRNELGIDTYSYGLTYKTSPTLGSFFAGKIDWLDFSSQPLWYFFTSLCRTISSSFLLMQMVISVVFNLLMVRFFKSVSNYVFTCILVFFCTKWFVYNFEVLRESICVALYLNAMVEYGKNNSLKSFLLFAIPAVFIHWFAFIMLLMFFIVVRTNIRVSLSISVILSILVLVSDVSTFEMFMALTVEQLDSSSEKLNGYLTKFNEGGYNMFFYLQMIITQIVPPLILIWRYSDGRNTNELEKRLLKFLPLYLIIGVSTSRLVIAYRLFNYIYPILVVFAVRALVEEFFVRKRLSIALLGRNQMLMIVLLVCISYSIYFDIQSFMKPVAVRQDSGDYDIRYIPYTTVFQEPNKDRTMYYEYWRNW